MVLGERYQSEIFGPTKKLLIPGNLSTKSVVLGIKDFGRIFPGCP